MRLARLITGALVVGALVACRGKRARPEPGPQPAKALDAAAPSADALGWCVTSLGRAAGLPPLERAGVIVRACGLCGGGFDPLLTADRAIDGDNFDQAAVVAVVEACGGICTPTAATAFHAGLADLGRDAPTIRPWRTLALACPTTMHADRDAARFASGAWYALATVGAQLAAARAGLAPDVRARLDAALTDLVLPLPPRSMTGNPLQLPSGAAQRPTPWLAISIVGDQLYLGPLPFARLQADGLHLAGAPVYPGAVVDRAAVAGAIAAAITAGPGFAVPDPPGRLDRPIILAPVGSRAARVLDVVAAVGDDPSYLAVAAAAPASMWPGQLAAHPIALAAKDPVRAPHLRIALTSGRVAAVDAAGKVVASAALPGEGQPMAPRLYAAATAMAPGGVIEVVAETGTVADLAALLDAALRGGAAGVIPAPPGAAVTAAPRPTFDGPALRALVAPP